VPGIRITRLTSLFGAALLAWAAETAWCQVGSTQSLVQNSSAQPIVSKNQLLTPEKAQRAMDRAQADFLNGRYESAQKYVQRALDICPHCAMAFTFQGILNLHGGDYADAAQAFQRAIEEDPSSGSAYLGLGIVYNTQGRFKEAIVPFDRAAPLLQSSWLFHFETALAHLGAGESEEGLRDITFADRLTESDPLKLSGIAYLRGVAHFQLRDYNGANRYLEEAVRHDPNGTYALLAKRRLEQLGPLTRGGR
jgi:tetratricopeptide (TPR) repeat protein